ASKFGADLRSTMAEGGGLSIGCFLLSQAVNISPAKAIARNEYFIIHYPILLQKSSITNMGGSFNLKKSRPEGRLFYRGVIFIWVYLATVHPSWADLSLLQPQPSGPPQFPHH
ncbi:MAG: hypothetical protein L0H75_01530, partial [Nitrosospira sp.]|nr:hypothetical protein [Nitrosospira sp.]